jgi:hypothetical protein
MHIYGSTALVGLGFFVEVMRSHSDTHTLGTTPLDERSARRKVFYLKTHNIHKRQTSMPPAGIEPAIPERKRPQTDALDRAFTGINQ